ncbi:MAG TPA: YciI family protein [Candidatus Solibacter sp.]|nr:YciI family protein [Candidatus Solibacter sp.]
MRYMFLIYTTETEMAKSSPEEMQKVQAGHLSVMADTSRKGILQGCDPLQSTATATTVRWRNGKAMTTDGPFAETKEQLAGYYILDCKDLDEAVQWAARIPTACGGDYGCVEIRPIREMSARPSFPETVRDHAGVGNG